MNADDYRDYLHASIPLTRAMGVRVVEAGPGWLKLAAPLAPNLNHHGTAFGGSLAVLGIVTGWALLDRALREAGVQATLVVRHSELDYHHPAPDELIVECRLPEDAQWTPFIDTVKQGSKARITLDIRVGSLGVESLRVRARYVALPQGADVSPG